MGLAKGEEMNMRWTEKRIMSPGYARFALRKHPDEISVMLVGETDDHVLVVGRKAYYLHSGEECDKTTASAAEIVAFGPQNTIRLV